MDWTCHVLSFDVQRSMFDVFGSVNEFKTSNIER